MKRTRRPIHIVLPALPDECACELIDCLHEVTAWVESQYRRQINRYNFEPPSHSDQLLLPDHSTRQLDLFADPDPF